MGTKIYRVVCENLGGFKFSAKCRGHEVIYDQPVESGGEDAGMKPPELLIASLGSCTGQVIVKFCKRHQIPTKGVTLTVTWEKEPAPGEINVKLHMPTKVPEEFKEDLIRTSEECLIHKTLHHPPKMKFSFEETE